MRYYQAWFELPPQGWQERKDREMKLDDEFGDLSDSESTPRDSTSLADSAMGVSGSNDAEWSYGGWNMGDSTAGGGHNGLERQDSLVIFDRSALSRDNHIVSITTTSDASSSSATPSAAAGWNPQCSHIYLYISMHLYSSRSLKTWLQEQRSAPQRPTTTALLHIFAQIVDAVAYLHSNGLMHRDLKPSNILFDNLNHIRIVDFGLATSLLRSKPVAVSVAEQPATSAEWADADGAGGDHPSLTSNVGTELYMSPEQQQGPHYDQRVDVFALGIIFVELLVPLVTEMERAVVLVRARKLQFDASLSPAEVAFASRLLNPDPALRPSCDEIFDDPILEDVASEVRTHRRRRSVSTNI